MKNPSRRIRSMRWWACVAANMALLSAAHVDAGQTAEISPDTWVRITTGTEVAGQGFAMDSRVTRGRVLSDDKQTSTLDVNGEAIRVARPSTTLEGALQFLDEKKLILRGPGDRRPIVVPRNAIINLDVRQRHSRKGLGVLIGVVAGGAIGYALGAATAPACRPQTDFFEALNCGFKHDLSPYWGAFLGVFGGVVLGHTVAPGAKWEKNVPLDHVGVSLGPTGGRGVGLSVSLGFGRRL